MLITNKFIPVGGMSCGPQRPCDVAAVSAPPVVLKEAHGEMAEMVESIRAAQEWQDTCPGDMTEAIKRDVDLQHLLSPNAAPGHLTLAAFARQQAVQPKSQAHHSVSVKEQHAKHGWLGGHLGLESAEHVTKYLGEAKAGLVAIKTNANQAASDSVDAALNKVSHVVVHNGHQIAETGLSTGLEVAAATLGAASGGLGVVLLKSGFKDFHKGIHHKDAEHAIEGANTVVVGTRSLAAGVAALGHLVHSSSFITGVAGLAQSTLAPLGIIHGTVDAALGVKDVFQGLRRGDQCKLGKGILSVGLGSSLVAAAAGGGLPALMAAGVFLTGKIVHTLCHSDHHAQSSLPQEPAQPRAGTVAPKESDH